VFSSRSKIFLHEADQLAKMNAEVYVVVRYRGQFLVFNSSDSLLFTALKLKVRLLQVTILLYYLNTARRTNL
jgi:hypothetical protein